MTDPGFWPPRSPLATGVRCRCPRCGRGRLFSGLLDVRPACETCGLDFSPLVAIFGIILVKDGVLPQLYIWIAA